MPDAVWNIADGAVVGSAIVAEMGKIKKPNEVPSGIGKFCRWLTAHGRLRICSAQACLRLCRSVMAAARRLSQNSASGPEGRKIVAGDERILRTPGRIGNLV